MQASSLNNILLGANAPLQVKGSKGAVASASTAKQPLGDLGMQEFASILNSTSGKSAASPKQNILQLLAQHLGQNPQLIEHPLMQKTGQALFGGAQEAMLDKSSVAELMQSPNPVGKLLVQLQSALNSNPALVQAVKTDPQAAAILNIQTGPGLEQAVKLNPNATLAEIKNTLVQSVQQQMNPQNIALGQERVLPNLQARNLGQNILQENVPNVADRKVMNRSINPAMKQYASEQSQFQSNIIKMPSVELEKTSSELELANTNDGAKVLPMMAQGHQAKNLQLQPQLSAAKQVLDLSHISASNNSELIEKISNYIQQNALQRVDGLDLTVRHNELGQFRISVSQQAGAENLHLQILTSTKEGHTFFKAHEGALVRSLSDAGISVGELQVMSGAPNRSFADSQSSADQKGGQFSSQHNSSNQQGDSHQRDSQRRRDLWEEYRQRFSA